jgi:hypothetical protein
MTRFDSSKRKRTSEDRPSLEDSFRQTRNIGNVVDINEKRTARPEGIHVESYPKSQTQPKKPAGRAQEKLLVSRREAAQVLSISQRSLDYLVATQRLPTRRIGGRVLIPMVDLRRYASSDHPERIVG